LMNTRNVADGGPSGPPIRGRKNEYYVSFPLWLGGFATGCAAGPKVDAFASLFPSSSTTRVS
jgi:hypothetical protein